GIAGDNEEPPDAAEGSGDLLDHAVGEIFLLRVTTHVSEGQHCNRGFVGERRAGYWLPGHPRRTDAGDAPRPRNVLEALLAEIDNLDLDLPAHLPKGVFGDTNATGFGNAFKAGGDVDALTKDVVALDQHVADVDADAPFHAALGGGPGIAFRRQPLQPQS